MVIVRSVANRRVALNPGYNALCGARRERMRAEHAFVAEYKQIDALELRD